MDPNNIITIAGFVIKTALSMPVWYSLHLLFFIKPSEEDEKVN
jgi:hypothetical protein